MSASLALVPNSLADGRDDPNFAEFAIGIPWGQAIEVNARTRVIEDTIIHKGREVQRKVQVTSGAGFPPVTHVDEQVINALINIGHLLSWASRKMNFTRSQLIEILGWVDNGTAFERVRQSLKKVGSLTFTFDNAWYNPEKDDFEATVQFSLYNGLRIVKREFEPPRKSTNPSQTVLACSTCSLEWGEDPYNLFRQGNLKHLNVDFLRSLRKRNAKRLYRFLDKAFTHSSERSFDLEDFASVHLGFSKGQGVAQYRRKFAASITELEERGFLEPMPIAERITKVRSKVYTITFKRGPINLEPKALSDKQVRKGYLPRMAKQLIEHGVSEKVAIRLASDPKNSEGFLKDEIDYFDFLCKKGTQFKSNRVGYLVKLIQDRAELSEEFFAHRAAQEKKKEAERKAAANRKQSQQEEQRKRKEEALQRQRDEQEREVFETLWNSLPSDEQGRIDAEILETANEFYREHFDEDSLTGKTARFTLRKNYLSDRVHAELRATQ